MKRRLTKIASNAAQFFFTAFLLFAYIATITVATMWAVAALGAWGALVPIIGAAIGYAVCVDYCENK